MEYTGLRLQFRRLTVVLLCTTNPVPSQNGQLADLQITNLLGEGGFAKVFRGLWRGLTVGIKVWRKRDGRWWFVGTHLSIWSLSLTLKVASLSL